MASFLLLYFGFNHSVFILPQKLSMGALSQQFPFLLILHTNPFFCKSD